MANNHVLNDRTDACIYCGADIQETEFEPCTPERESVKQKTDAEKIETYFAVDLDRARKDWPAWLLKYGAAEFFDAFMRNAQGAEGRCVHCDQRIYLDIAEGGGVPDWRTADGDYGCSESPDTCEDGCGSHIPRRIQDDPRTC